tara:strand:- start:678 stop:1394 length:717 start_codon:yes stop_codon:yes gene_type:complete
MAEASGGSGVSKAIFVAEGGKSFAVQYNPKDFKFDKSVTWQPHKDQGTESPLEFQKVNPATMAMELIFDTTHDQSDVRTVWVNRLLSLTNPDVKPIGGEAGTIDKSRPPIVDFIWGDFKMKGVFESLNVSYMMFSSTGTPIRAKVSLKMKEWKPGRFADGEPGPRAGYGSAPTQLVTVQAGDTASSLAHKHGVPVKKLCEDNGWDNPLEDVKAGIQAVIKREARKALPGVPSSIWDKF